jgi:hypothetical protein
MVERKLEGKEGGSIRKVYSRLMECLRQTLLYPCITPVILTHRVSSFFSDMAIRLILAQEKILLENKPSVPLVATRMRVTFDFICCSSRQYVGTDNRTTVSAALRSSSTIQKRHELFGVVAS